MKKVIILIIALIASIIAGSYYVTQQKTPSHANARKIAIFTPITHPALEEVEQGFKETLQKADKAEYAFTTFNANGNKTLMRAQAEEIVQGGYDLIATLGASCSQSVVEISKKKGSTTPIVFCAVDDKEFAQSLVASNPHVTGVYVKTNYQEEMNMLLNLKPNTKNVLLVYDPTVAIGLEKDKQEIETILKNHDVTLHAAQIYKTNEIGEKVPGLLSGMDVVLVLIDNTIVAGIDSLVTLCNRYGVTLLVSDLGSSTKGAALAYGITEYESGAGAAQKAFEILINGKKAAELTISAVTNFRVVVNKKTMQAQKMQVSDEAIKEFGITFVEETHA